MRLKKKILIGLAAGFVAIQFFRPARNKSDGVLPINFARICNVPDSVQTVLQVACYDCHSDNTRYPWYVNIQPMGWVMAKHIRNGKEKLNFSEFGNYSTRRQISKLKGIAGQIRDDDMPLPSYKLIHSDARIPPEQKKSIMNWMLAKADSLSANN